MFGWRRKHEGFDWHKYVRTTIKLRRQERQDRLEKARDMAGERAKAAGKAAAAKARDGAVQAGQGVRKGWAAAGRGANNFAASLAPKLDALGRGIAKSTSPVLVALARPGIAGPMAIAGGIALAAGLYRGRRYGFDSDATAPLGIGVALLLLALPALLDRFGFKLAATPRKGRGIAVAALAGLIAVAGAGASVGRWSPSLPTLGAFTSMRFANPLASTDKPVEGRATAVSGDILRIDGRLIRLDGIEAPDRQQSCTRQPGAKRWRCGEAAQSALERAIRSKTVRCEINGRDDAERATGVCTIEGRDIAGDLVREGHVFSNASLLGGYSAEDAEARQNKSGLWSGDVERPAEFRAKAWEAAKKSAPDGCPIKAKVTSSGKTYLQPWSPDYGSVTVRAGRGERWFCSERDAIAAGFRSKDG